MKTILTFLFFLTFQSLFSQSITIENFTYTFNMQIDSQKLCPSNLSNQGCEYDCIKCSDCNFGKYTITFYSFNDNLVCIDITVADDTPFPSLKSLDDKIADLKPFRVEEIERHINQIAYEETFLFNNTYILRSSLRQYTRYIIIPPDILKSVRTVCKEFFDTYFQ